MDYTEIPRSLIYKDRMDIDDFCIDCTETIEHHFYEHLIQRPFIQNALEAHDYVLAIFNNAYYICTLIQMDKHPELSLNKYLSIASKNHRETFRDNRVKSVTMALVCSILSSYENYKADDGILNSIRNVFRDWDLYSEVDGVDDFRELFFNTDSFKAAPSDKPRYRFAPRIIDEHAIREAESDLMLKGMDWRSLTWAFNPTRIDKLIKALSKNEEEERILRITLSQNKKSQAENIVAQSHSIKESQSYIHELEAENQRLKEEVKKYQEEDEEEEKCDEKVLYNKVSFEMFLRLLEESGFDQNNTGNKTRAGFLWYMMTGKSADELRRFCSMRAYRNNHTNADVKRLNELLSEMGITNIVL